MDWWNPPVRQTTTGGACSFCGRAYYEQGGLHGDGICNKVPSGEVRYIGVTPEQVRQIVREVLRAAMNGFGEQR